MMQGSWKMKLAGVLAAVVAVGGAVIALLNGSQPDWAAVLSAVVASAGLFMARHDKVSSEESGAK